MRCLWDTDVLAQLMRGKHRQVLPRAASYLSRHGKCTFSLITRYEVLRGLKAVRATTKLRRFEAFCNLHDVLPVTEAVILIAADLWADLKRTGRLIGDNDVLIAATALHHNLPVATGNVAHFNRIPGLTVEDWTKP